MGASERVESLDAVLEALPEPVVVHERGRVLTANQAFLTLMGVTLDEVRGSPAIDRVHPDDRAAIAERITASSPRNRRTPEHRIVAKDGTAIPVEVTGVPFPYEGRVVALAIVHDLRERKRIEAELAANERLASLGRLASSVGHEINNPLTYVLGALELLTRDIVALDADIAGPLLQRVDQALDGATRVREIVRDLKALSSQPDEPRGTADLHRALETAIATTAHEVEHRARLVRDYGVVPAVCGTENRLVQVFVNLLVNAAHAIDDGNAAANEIRIVTRRDGEASVAIEVIDTGHGFAADEAARLFEPFFTTKQGSGSGLGLSISQRIVRGFGGTLGAEPRSPRGACLRVVLPASAGVPPPRLTPRFQPIATIRARVLFADDEPLIRNVAVSALDAFDVVAVASGREAIAALESSEFDAIVCDLQMPDLGGVDVYEWIAAHRPMLAAKTVFITGGAFTERGRAFLDRVQRPYLPKPFDLDGLNAAVAKLLR